jgi:hypothetical protein
MLKALQGSSPTGRKWRVPIGDRLDGFASAHKREPGNQAAYFGKLAALISLLPIWPGNLMRI